MSSLKHLVAFAFLAVATPVCLAVPAPAPTPGPRPRPYPNPQLLPPILTSILPPILTSILPTILPNPIPTCPSGPVECCDGLTGLTNLLPNQLTDVVNALNPIGIDLNSDAPIALNCQPATLSLVCVSGSAFCCSTVVPLPDPASLIGSVGLNCTDAPAIGPILP